MSTYGPSASAARGMDLEKGEDLRKPILLTWSDLTYSVKGRLAPIIESVDGSIASGQLMAIMGPSGAGKSTMLDVLCRRVPALRGSIQLNGSSDFKMNEVLSFVEQDDALYGTLTVRETIAYAAHLSLPRDFTGMVAHIDNTLRALGLQDIADNKIGTPISRGISGGQKRRVTIGCSLVARPRVLVLDEPTSGLDAASGREVIAAIKRLAVETNTICIATIHQPNYETFALFDSLLLLAGGRVMYNGPTDHLDEYLEELGFPVPQHSNPSDHAIAIVNTEFYDSAGSTLSAKEHLDQLAKSWRQKSSKYTSQHSQSTQGDIVSSAADSPFRSSIHKTGILIRRNLQNYSRNILAFGIRLGMYAGMGFLLAVVWINLGTSSSKIQDRLSVHFFSVAFLGFMSVSGIPSFLEERAVFVRERANGLYGPGPYVLANTITVVPFLFACTLLYSLIAYFAIGLHPGGAHFFKFLIYLFLGVFAAESQSILIAAAIPIFVAALAIAAFANGLWMVVQGYFIRATNLPRFFYYSLHFMDYQTFAFELLVINDFVGLEFQCPEVGGSCACPLPSTLTPAVCALTGSDVVNDLGYQGVSTGLYVGILLIIILVYRLALYGVLVLKKR